MKNRQVGSKEFFQEHRELTITTFPVGQFMGIAGGAGAMEVGGKGSWKPMR